MKTKDIVTELQELSLFYSHHSFAAFLKKLVDANNSKCPISYSTKCWEMMDSSSLYKFVEHFSMFLKEEDIDLRLLLSLSRLIAPVYLRASDLEKKKLKNNFIAGISYELEQKKYVLLLNEELLDSETNHPFVTFFIIMHELFHAYWDHPIEMVGLDDKESFYMNVALDVKINSILSYILFFIFNVDYENYSLSFSYKKSSDPVSFSDLWVYPFYDFPTLRSQEVLSFDYLFKIISMPYQMVDFFSKGMLIKEQALSRGEGSSGSSVIGERGSSFSRGISSELMFIEDTRNPKYEAEAYLYSGFLYSVDEILLWLKSNIEIPENKPSLSLSSLSEIIKDITEEELKELEEAWERLKNKVEEESSFNYLDNDFEDFDNRKIKVEDSNTFYRFCEKNLLGFYSSGKYAYGYYNFISSSLPGSIKMKKPRIGVLLDTSGSVGIDLAQKFLACISSLSKKYEVHICMSDTSVRGNMIVLKSSKKLKEIDWKGGGGTDLTNGIKFLFKQGFVLKYQMYFVFTDGCMPEIKEISIPKNLFFVIPKEETGIPPVLHSYKKQVLFC